MYKVFGLLVVVVGLSYLLRWSFEGSGYEWMALVFLVVVLIGLVAFLKNSVAKEKTDV